MSVWEKIFALPKPRILFTVALGEFTATFFLMLLGCLSMSVPGFTLVQLAIAWGFIVANIVQVFGPICGANVNPVVTTAAVILGVLSPALGFIYYICQILGSLLGIYALKLMLPKENWDFGTQTFGGVCMTRPAKHVTDYQAVVLEFIATSFLILIVCSAHDPRTAHNHDSFALKVAGVIIADVILVGPLTGASLNPARTLGPAIVTNYWKSHWVYWVGPLLAGIVTPIIYLIFWMPKPQEDALDPALVESLFVKLRKGPEVKQEAPSA